MTGLTQMSNINPEESDKPPSYHGETNALQTTMGKNSFEEQVVIGVDDAIESIGFGKFQRRVL